MEVTFTALLALTEPEARALSVLFSYEGGPEGFIQTFYQKMGRHYLEPHVAGIHSLAKTLREQVDPHLATVDKCRKAINEALTEQHICPKCGGRNRRHYSDCPVIIADTAAKALA